MFYSKIIIYVLWIAKLYSVILGCTNFLHHAQRQIIPVLLAHLH